MSSNTVSLVFTDPPTGNTLSKFDYELSADGMRTQLAEIVEQPTGTDTEDNIIDYKYDNLNRITQEYADVNGTSDWYSVDYEYDIIGNRTKREVAVNGQNLTTDYVYYSGTDKLQKETHTGPVYAVYLHENDRYYAYATPNGGYFYRDTRGHTIGSLQAFFIGLPSVWSRYLFVVAMALVPVLLFGPGLLRLANRYVLRRPVSVRLRVPRKGIYLLMAFLMLFGPEHFHSLAQAEVQYANLSTASWAQGNRDIHYSYDDNGSLTEKITAIKDEPDPQTYFEEKVTNTYNLQNRLEMVTTTRGDTVEVTEYTYNDDGIRVKSQYSRTVSSVTDQARTIVYLVDSFNHTGYAQTLEEETVTTDYIDGVPQTPVTETTTYLIGDDVIAQTKDGTTQYLLYDGHGSTRQLAEYDTDVTIVDSFSYDGYGVLLQDNAVASSNPGKVGTQATNLLYAGEQFDTDLQMYYNRARYYNPSNGLFNRMDPFSGNNLDPQSLHKYNYVYNNPVNGVDPSGKFIGGITNLVNAVAIRVMFFGMRYGPTIAAGTFAVTKVTAAMLMATITHMALQELGVLPHNELVAEIGAILGYALIAELFIISMLPPSWISPPQAQGRGMNNTVVRKAVDTGIRVHYDKTTDPTRYSHRGCPTQLKKEIYHDTEFWFARRGQKGLDVKYLGGPHPSTYPGSKWPAGINRADFKPDTPTGRAFKLPPNTYRIFYDPQTGEIK